MAAINVMKSDIDMSVKYWENKVAFTGGMEDTMNTNEKTNYEESLWV